MRLGCLLLAKLACAESGFDEGITLQQENFKTVADLEPSLPTSIFDDQESESSGTLHPGQFDVAEGDQVAVIFTEVDKDVVDRANIIVPQSDDAGDGEMALENRSNMHNRPRKKEQQILDKLTDIESDIKGVEIALEERNLEEEIENEDNTMIIAIAAGVGCLFMLSILLVVACCISRKRARRRHESNREKHRKVEANPAEQTFERLDFTHASVGTTKRQKKLESQKPESGDVTSSEIAPSSMGTLRTYIDRSNTTMVKNCLAGNESDFRNTSSDIDSIESSNPPKKIINHVIAEKKKYSGYQELATRDRSNYSSSSTASSCEHVMGIGAPPTQKPKQHHVILEEGAPPAYETITRSRDSVIDL